MSKTIRLGLATACLGWPSPRTLKAQRVTKRCTQSTVLRSQRFTTRGLFHLAYYAHTRPDIRRIFDLLIGDNANPLK